MSFHEHQVLRLEVQQSLIFSNCEIGITMLHQIILELDLVVTY